MDYTGEQRLPDKPPALPHNQASDLKILRSYGEAELPEHAHLWSDSVTNEFYGLLEADTFHEA